ncbi:hypothetical protein L2E82_39536 [Cichorium intybus]|uniref:Uncharacterized protein n=1 Tax=Cichorium intybus TaxID=13427 RepID=A0ACB9AJG4_CICIN|nr:hypothetical protein L2E82_39536 [Cichorium intybus]
MFASLLSNRSILHDTYPPPSSGSLYRSYRYRLSNLGFSLKTPLNNRRHNRRIPQAVADMYTAAENEEDSRPSLMRRTTIGDGPFESILDWTQESSTLATQNTNNHVFSTKHLRLLQCQNGLYIFEELLEFDFLEVLGMGFHITQPGSSVATSLIDGESKPKHVLLVEIKGNQYHPTKIPLHFVRPFEYKEVVLKDESDIDPNDQNSIVEHLDNVVNSLIEKCGRKDSTNSETMLPLIRVKVLYNDGEVEVLRFDKEKWKLIEKTPKPTKRNKLSKSPNPKRG